MCVKKNCDIFQQLKIDGIHDRKAHNIFLYVSLADLAL